MQHITGAPEHKSLPRTHVRFTTGTSVLAESKRHALSVRVFCLSRAIQSVGRQHAIASHSHEQRALVATNLEHTFQTVSSNVTGLCFGTSSARMHVLSVLMYAEGRMMSCMPVLFPVFASLKHHARATASSSHSLFACKVRFPYSQNWLHGLSFV
jgi:hypothetical protein